MAEAWRERSCRERAVWRVGGWCGGDDGGDEETSPVVVVVVVVKVGHSWGDGTFESETRSRRAAPLRRPWGIRTSDRGAAAAATASAAATERQQARRSSATTTTAAPTGTSY